MSEFNPFSAAEEAPEYVPEAAEENAEGSRKKIIGLGALAAVALGAGAFLLLGGGGEDELGEFVPGAAVAPAAAPAATATTAATLPAASNVTLGRNPFRALYVQPAAAPEPVEAPAATTPTAPPVETTPVVIIQPAPAPAQPAPAPAQPAPAPEPAQSTVALKGVTTGPDGSNPMATFDYDGEEVSGAPGDVMSGKLLVISIQQDATGGWFANLQLGDGSPFEVHERQVVVVQ